MKQTKHSVKLLAFLLLATNFSNINAMEERENLEKNQTLSQYHMVEVSEKQELAVIKLFKNAISALNLDFYLPGGSLPETFQKFTSELTQRLSTIDLL